MSASSLKAAGVSSSAITAISTTKFLQAETLRTLSRGLDSNLRGFEFDFVLSWTHGGLTWT
jgi:hypothetical protein